MRHLHTVAVLLLSFVRGTIFDIRAQNHLVFWHLSSAHYFHVAQWQIDFNESSILFSAKTAIIWRQFSSLFLPLIFSYFLQRTLRKLGVWPTFQASCQVQILITRVVISPEFTKIRYVEFLRCIVRIWIFALKNAFVAKPHWHLPIQNSQLWNTRLALFYDSKAF